MPTTEEQKQSKFLGTYGGVAIAAAILSVLAQPLMAWANELLLVMAACGLALGFVFAYQVEANGSSSRLLKFGAATFVLIGSVAALAAMASAAESLQKHDDTCEDIEREMVEKQDPRRADIYVALRCAPEIPLIG